MTKNRPRNGVRLALLPVAAAATALIAVNPSLGCVDHLPPTTIMITFLPNDQASICINNFATFGVSAGSGQVCVCAFKKIGPIESVLEATLVNAATRDPIEGFDFVANSNTSNGFNDLDPGDWQGFAAAINETIPPDILVDLCVLVQLAVPPCPWKGTGVLPDVNGNGTVDIDDLVEVILNFGISCPMGCPWDVNGSGSVDVDDIVQVIIFFGVSCPLDTPPGTLSLGQQLLDDLTAAPTIVGTDEGDAQGAPSGGHLFISGADGIDFQCYGNADGNGIVNNDDNVAITLNWGNVGAPGIPGDADLNGVVNNDDHVAVTLAFGHVSLAAS